MEAHFFSAALIAVSALSLGANYRTQNFIITAATPELAREIGDSGEAYRRTLAQEWLGRELPPWSEPCPVTVKVGSHLGAGGATSFCFHQGQPYGWRMEIQGSRERLLDSVLPHEVTHMIFATHFGRPLPRWADEGACTTVEHVSEKAKQQHLLVEFLTTGRGIAFNKMFAMKDYPKDILPLYSQGYSLARYLIAAGGRQKFVAYVGDGMNLNNWTLATKKHYGFESLSDLQITWLDWVRLGSPATPRAPLVAEPAAPPAELLAAGTPRSRAQLVTPVAYVSNPAESAVQPPQSSGRFAAFASSDGWHSRPRAGGAMIPPAPQSLLAQNTVTGASRPMPPFPADTGYDDSAARGTLARPQGPETPAATSLQLRNGPGGTYLEPTASTLPLIR